jgi:hypothetical protein
MQQENNYVHVAYEISNMDNAEFTFWDLILEVPFQ